LKVESYSRAPIQGPTMYSVVLRARRPNSYLAIRTGDLVLIEFGRGAWVQRPIGEHFRFITMMLLDGDLEPISPLPYPTLAAAWAASECRRLRSQPGAVARPVPPRHNLRLL